MPRRKKNSLYNELPLYMEIFSVSYNIRYQKKKKKNPRYDSHF